MRRNRRCAASSNQRRHMHPYQAGAALFPRWRGTRKSAATPETKGSGACDNGGRGSPALGRWWRPVAAPALAALGDGSRRGRGMVSTGLPAAGRSRLRHSGALRCAGPPPLCRRSAALSQPSFAGRSNARRSPGRRPGGRRAGRKSCARSTGTWRRLTGHRYGSVAELRSS